MKKSTWLASVLLACMLASWNVVSGHDLRVFTTYDDYLNNTPKVYTGLQAYSWAGIPVKLKFKQNGKHFNLKCEGIWGFAYDSVLFRVSGPSEYITRQSGHMLGIPFMVLCNEDWVYYENGTGYLMETRWGAVDRFELNYPCGMISRDLNSSMVPLGCYKLRNWMDDEVLRFFARYDEFRESYEILKAMKEKDKTHLSYSDVRDETLRLIKERANRKH